jgi:hypothetical protein
MHTLSIVYSDWLRTRPKVFQIHHDVHVLCVSQVYDRFEIMSKFRQRRSQDIRQ